MTTQSGHTVTPRGRAESHPPGRGVTHSCPITKAVPSMPLTAAERSQNARRAALARSASNDGTAMTEPKRRAFEDSFLPGGSRGGADPGNLSEAERQRRGRAAYRAYMLGLSQKAAHARRMAAGALADTEAVEAEIAEVVGELADELADEAI